MKHIARTISFITNPVFILFPLPYLLIFRFGYGHITSLKWTIFTSIFLIIAGLFVIFEVKNKTFSDMDVSKREQRPYLFFIISIITVIYSISLFIFGAPNIMFFTVWGILVGILATTLINTKIKASLHVSTMTAVLITIVKLYELSNFFFLLIPIVAWARVEIRRHSLKEVVTGLVLGTSLTVFMYILLKYTYSVKIW